MSFIKNVIKKNKHSITFVSFFALLFFCSIIHAQAATLSISPSAGAYTIGNTITVKVVVDSGGQSINAVSGALSFSNNTLSLQGISKTGIVTLWATDPSYSNSAGTAAFQGVILNGYTGSSGTVLTFTFKAKAAGSAIINLSTGGSSVLLNDGQGTNVLSGTNGASLTINPAAIINPTTVTATKPAITSSSINTTVIPVVTIVSPLFTAYQSPLVPGNFVVVKGTGPENSTITVTFTDSLQDGTTTVTQTVLPTSNTGAFTFVSDQKVSEGNTYTLVASTADGQQTAPLTLSVRNSLWFNFSIWIKHVFALKMDAWLAVLLLLISIGYSTYRIMILKHLLRSSSNKK